jgi:hypothetical protein
MTFSFLIQSERKMLWRTTASINFTLQDEQRDERCGWKVLISSRNWVRKDGGSTNRFRAPAASDPRQTEQAKAKENKRTGFGYGVKGEVIGGVNFEVIESDRRRPIHEIEDVGVQSADRTCGTKACHP